MQCSCNKNQIQKYSTLKLFADTNYFQGCIVALYHAQKLLFTGGSTSFSRIVSRFEEGKSKGEFFSSIYVRSSLNLGGVSLIYYNTVSILHEQYHTKDTSEQCVCVPSNVSHPKSGSGKCVCVCVPSPCVPSIKSQGGNKKLGFFLCVWCPILFF